MGPCALSRAFASLCLASILAAGHASAQDSPRKIRWGGDVKAHFRHSTAVETAVGFPFPPSFIGPAQAGGVYERTVSDGGSFEVSNASLIGEAELSPHVSARLQVHFLDLYNRNPTSSDDRIAVREAWVRLGRKTAPLEPAAGTSVYMTMGKAPRFSKPAFRRLESYGLWSTAVGRLEELQVELGGSLGKNVYWRAAAANGNPLFFRDPNALAGDNGTPERVPQPPGTRPITGTVPVHESGFPILYDAKASDLSLDGNLQLGAGLGVRLKGGEGTKALDALGWYFHRELAEAAAIRGTFYLGDLTLLRGVLFPLPFEGNDKSEMGVNVDARRGDARLFAQYVSQDIASLGRTGFEVELAYIVPLNGLFVSGDTPIGNWIQPALRFSSLQTDFATPAEFPAPSVGFDWRKWDVGVRAGVLRGVDVTLEYARLDMITPAGTLHPDELLLTLRAEF